MSESLVALALFLCGVVTGICVRAGGDEWRKAARSWKLAFWDWRGIWREQGPNR